nr:hypothetical protein [Methanobacterium formicicum]
MDKIVAFSGTLREKGIPVSIRSTHAGKEVSKLIDEEDPLFKSALAAVYVKEQRQRESFNQVFDEFFEGVVADGEEEGDEGTSSKASDKNVWSKSSQKWVITNQEDDNSEVKAPEIHSSEFNYHPHWRIIKRKHPVIPNFSGGILTP